MKKKTLVFLFFVLLVLIPFQPGGRLRAQQDVFAQGKVTVKGLTLTIDPPEQTVPVNIPTIVTTVFSMESPQLMKGMVVKGDLRGPGLSKAIVLTTLPNHPFSIPGLSSKGNYYLENIRLERNGTELMKAAPQNALIRVMDIVVTQVKTEPLTLEQIYEKGIKITEENFTVFNFSVGIMVESTEYRYDFPVVYGGGAPYIPQTSGIGSGGFGGGGMGSIGKRVVPFELKFPEITGSGGGGGDSGGGGNKLTGVLIFNNDIAVLHQFFSVMFIVGNAAPDGSSIAFKDVKATITYPDGLREAGTTPPHIVGTPIPVRCPGPDEKIGTADDLDIIVASFSGMAEFLAEGLKKGTHFLTVHFEGTLTGLPTGDVPVEGTASGAVLVKDPEFSIAFSHPDVIREGEEYDIYVTMTNTSSVPANLVSLTMPASQLIGTRLMSAETATFETIAPGDSETAQFHMLSNETGEVRATAFKADENITGRFILTAGVGEKGIPLSPDTLVLPRYVYLASEEMPGMKEIVNQARLSLGEAHSVATTPPGGLPSHLPMVRVGAVETRVIELTEAAQRIIYGDNLPASLQVLALDWQGNRTPDLPFDILRRLTSKGKRFAAAIATEFNTHIQNQGITPKLFQKSFADTCSYKNPFVSAVLSFPGGTRNARLLVKDYYQNELTAFGEELTRDIPFGEIYLLEDVNQTPVDFALIAYPEEIITIVNENTEEMEIIKEYRYTIEVVGEITGDCDLSLILPDGNGGFQQASFPTIQCQPGGRSIVSFTVRKADETTGGTVTWDSTLQQSVTTITKPSLQLLGAVQDCIVDNAGHVVALLFNRSLTNDAGALKAYFYPDKEEPHYFRDHFSFVDKNVYAAFRQASERVVLVGLDNPISPFVESKIYVEKLLDTDGNPMAPSPVEMVVESTIKTPGGIVYGRVFTAANQPVDNADVRLEEYEGDGDIVRSYTRTDAFGNYQFDFVRILHDPFRIVVTDITNGKSERLNGRLSVDGQRFNMDIFMKGRGIVRGVVVDENGKPVPSLVDETGNVISGAHAFASAGNEGAYEFFDTPCNKEGKFEFSDLPLGAVNIRGSYGGLFGVADTVISFDGEFRDVVVNLAAGQTGSVSGRILENDGITPVEGAALYIYHDGRPLNYVKYSDEDGFFLFEVVPVGNFTVYSSKGPSVSGSVSANQTASIVIILRGKGAIEGIVKDHNNNGCNNISIYIMNTQFSDTTDENGGFKIEDVPVGTYSIIAYNPETYQQVMVNNVYLKHENTTVGTVLVFPAPPGKGEIFGTLWDYKNQILTETDIWVFDNAFNYIKTVQSDEVDGSFRVLDLTVGKYVLAVSLADQAGAASAVILRPGDVPTADILCRGMGTLGISVWERTYDENGQLIKTARVMADVEVRHPKFVIKSGVQVGFTGAVSRFVTDPERDYQSVGPIFTGDYSVSAENIFHPYGASMSGELILTDEITPVELYLNPTGSVTVTVRDYDNSLLGGAPVTFKRGSAEREAFTEPDGTFTFEIVPPGNFSIEAEYPGTAVMRKGEKHGYMGFDGQQMELELLLRGTGTVGVIVTDASGENVESAQVKFRYIGYPNETKEGVYTNGVTCVFPDVLTGNFAVEVLADTGTGGRTRGTLQAHGDLVTVTVKLDPTGTVTGKVLEPDNETPADVAQVRLFSNGGDAPLGYITTAADGAFEFKYVPLGSYRLEAYEPFTGREGDASGNIPTDGGETEATTDVRLKGIGNVSGTVYDGSGVSPLVGAYVKIEGGNIAPNRNTATNDLGNYRFERVAEGGFTVSAKDLFTELWGEAQGTVEYDQQEVVVDIYGRETGTVEVYVKEADEITPVTGATVNLVGMTKTPSYDQTNGKYIFSYIPKGAFTVTAARSVDGDGGSAQGEIQFHGQTAEVTVLFHGFGTVTGVVTDAGGNPQGGISVKLKIGGNVVDNDATVVSGDDLGKFYFTNVPPGPFTVEVEDVVFGESASIDGNLLGAGDNVDVVLEFRPVGTVTGNVIINTNGDPPAEKAYITLTGDGFSHHGFTEPDGSFAFNRVELDSFTLEVRGYAGSGLAKTSGDFLSGTPVDLGALLLDNTRPEVFDIIPADGTLGVTVDTSVTVTFSEEMDASCLNSNYIKVYGGGAAVACGISPAADGMSVVLTPTMQSFVSYAVILDETIRDASGNTMGIPFTATFTTVDLVGPSVVSVNPLNTATEVPVLPVITVTFSEPIDTSQFVIPGNMALSKGVGDVGGTVQFGENSMTALFTPYPSPLETDSTYTVTVQGVKDMAGNSQAALYTSIFSTLDNTAPVLTLAPAGGTTIVEGSEVFVTADTGTAPDIASVYFFINGELTFTDIDGPYVYSDGSPLISEVGDNFLLEAYAVDKAGNQSNRPGITFYLSPDDPPVVTLTGPSDTDVWPGNTVSFTVEANDDLGLTDVYLTAVGGAVNVEKHHNVGGQSCTELFTISIPTATLPDTQITVNAEAVDNADHRATAPAFVLNVPDDQQAPTAVFDSPAGNESFAYNSVMDISVTLSDDIGINIDYDDEVRKKPVISISYDGLQENGTLTLETTSIKEGNNYIASASYTVPQLTVNKDATISVTAEDLSGKTVTASVNVYLSRHVDEDAPVVSLVTPTTGTLVYPEEQLPVWVTASDDSSGINRIEFFRDENSTPFVTVTEAETGTDGLYKAVYSVPPGEIAGDTFTIKAVAWEHKDVLPKSSFVQTVCVVVDGDIEYIDTNTVIDDVNYTSYQDKTLVIKDGAVLSINCPSQFTFRHILVKGTGILTHGETSTTDVKNLDIITTGKVVVGPEAKIDTTGKGYLGGYHDPNINESHGRTWDNGVIDGSNTSSGASYGGLGGKHENSAVNPVYGSIYDPVDPGSGGGGISSFYYGGDGGGVIRIDAPEMIVDGSITSNGGSPSNGGNAGAGSGGSIRLDVVTLKGTGEVTANGGKTGISGSGGGGRIALYYSDTAYFDLDKITAHGGDVENVSGESGVKGSAGTIYLKKNDLNGKVIISQNENGTTNATPLTGGLEGQIDVLTNNTLRDDQADFVPGSLVGMLLQPNIGDSRTFKIILNDDKEITVELVDSTTLMTVANDDDFYRVKHPADILLQDGTTHISGSVSAPVITLDNADLILDGTLTVDTLSLQNGSKLIHSPATTTAFYSLHVIAGDIDIDSASSVDVTACGYPGGYQGDNDGNLYGLTYDGDGQADGSKGFAAGSYGGHGGHGGYGGNNSYIAGKIYGSFTTPSLPGSGGGGTSSVSHGGSGGGVILLEASSMVLEGNIYANGGSADNSAGSGSGGSIHIDVTTLQGEGTISANGGNSINSAGGGGGRIAISYLNAGEFNLENNIAACGGTYTNGDDISRNGGPGTIYLKNKGDGEVGRLVFKNTDDEGNVITCHNPLAFPVIKPAAITTVTLVDSQNNRYQLETEDDVYMPGSLVGMKLISDINTPGTYFTITANGRTTITVDGNLTGAASYKGILVYDEQLEITDAHVDFDRDVEIGTLIISGNGSLGHPVTAADSSSYSYLSITADTVTVEVGGSIDVTGRGYLGGYRDMLDTDYGYNGRTFGNTKEVGSGQMCGASFGGIGGRSYSRPVNDVYGSLYEPFVPGSGGGAYNSTGDMGGNGGGVIRIQADQLTLNGSIHSNGGVAALDFGGCGSGGSIWIETQTLTGTGTLQANGGGGKYRGGGGGGRIAVYYDGTLLGFDLNNNITAHGGNSIEGDIMYNAGAGTIFLKDKTSTTTTLGDLVIDNNGIWTWDGSSGNAEYTTPLPGVGQGTYTTLDNLDHSMTVGTDIFITDALKGIKLNLNPSQTTPVFTIFSNTKNTIFTDPAEGDLTGSGDYIGEHHLFKLTVKGRARVQTPDRIIVDPSRLTVDTDSALNKAE